MAKQPKIHQNNTQLIDLQTNNIKPIVKLRSINTYIDYARVCFTSTHQQLKLTTHT